MITVAICTHNPRLEYLSRVLKALEEQTLPLSDWELIVIDNASKVPVASQIDLSWHPAGRHVREEALGLTHARLRAIKEASGELIVNVDDDNVLDKEYLVECARIARARPFIGAWGGQIFGEFEVPPPEPLKHYLGYALGMREFQGERWSNLTANWDTVPIGAGMCIRTTIARVWSDRIDGKGSHVAFGRVGAVLNACEDTDLALTACDEGFGTGRFASLKLTHLIPKERLTPRHISGILEGATRSTVLLLRMRNELEPSRNLGFGEKCREFIRRGIRELGFVRMPPEVRMIERAKLRGERTGWNLQI